MNLLDQLRDFWRERRQELDTQFKRTLPFGDYVVDRWEKARALGFGEGASIYDSALVIGDVSVGEETWIGPGAVLDGSAGLTIGSFCSISAGAQIYTHDTVQWAISGGMAAPESAPTRVGDCCYIGPNSIIAKGVTIGDGCIVGAASVVLGDIPAGSKAVGAPARVIGNAAAGDGPNGSGGQMTEAGSVGTEGLPAPRDIASFRIGEGAEVSRTFDARAVAEFATLVGDNNPIHLDEQYAEATRFGRCIVHGPLYSSLIGTVLGTACPGPGTILVSDERRFQRPVFVGDCVTARVEVTDIDPDRRDITLDVTCRNQHGEVVLSGVARTRLAR
jgi:acyl dehydratase/acetyltransferase-like isoleucine patch superfamily enzyme